MMPSTKRFGEYAVEMEFCSSYDVERAVQIQEDLTDRGFPRALIGLVMVRYGIISNSQLIEVLKVLEHEQVAVLAMG